MKDTRFKVGNPGKPIGAKNKIVIDLREKVSDFINKNWSNVQSDFEELEPKDKLAFIEKLMAYSIPKLAAVNNTVQFENMSDEQLDEIINRLKNEGNG